MIDLGGWFGGRSAVAREMKPLVSVVIPAYNYANFIPECIDSVLEQTYPSIEIIIVDDGSTDNTREIVERYRESVSYIFQENRGLSAARNRGAEAARGTYLKFLDSDDLLHPRTIEFQVAQMLEHGENFISVSKSLIFRTGGARGRKRFKAGWRLYFGSLDIHLCRLNVAPPHAYMLHREFFLRLSGFDVTYKGCEDYDFWLRALGQGAAFLSNFKSLVYYRVHSRSMGQLKANSGAYPFDILVHEKKANKIYGKGVDRALATTAGMLAMLDGMCRTYVKVDVEANPEGKARLLEVCYKTSFYLRDKTGVLVGLEELLYACRIVDIYKSKVEDLRCLEGLVQTLESYLFSCAGAWRVLMSTYPLYEPEQRSLFILYSKVCIQKLKVGLCPT